MRHNLRTPDDDSYIHLPACHDATDTLTLCGMAWSDGPTEYTDKGATCRPCLAVVKHVKAVLTTRKGGRARGKVLCAP